MMNKYLKAFFHRGLIFSWIGPIVTGIVFFFISLVDKSITFTGLDVFLGVVSTYLLAFIAAGASIINQIEHWPIVKRSLIHSSILYVAYLFCYLVNSWIPFDWIFVLVFTSIFILTYLLIWLIVYLSVRHTTKKMNQKLN